MRDNQLCALSASLSAFVVHVQIEKPKFAVQPLVLEISPTAHARVSGIPTLRRHIRSLREPKRTAVQQRETLLLVKYRAVFAFGHAIVAPCTDIGIAVQTRQHIGQLAVTHLLRSEYVEIAETYHIAQAIDTLRPSVAVFVILCIEGTHVITRNIERLGAQRRDRKG